MLSKTTANGYLMIYNVIYLLLVLTEKFAFLNKQLKGFIISLTQPYWKMKFLKLANCIGYVIAKLSKYVKISMQTSSDSFLLRILLK